MSARPAVFAMLAFGAFAIPVSRIAPPPTKYHFDLKAETTVDLSVVGGPTQQTNVGINAWVVMSLSDSGGGRVIHAIVDSLKAETTLPQITLATADSAKGGMIHGFLDPSGRVKALVSKPPANALLASVQGIINGLFPRMKGGAKPGDKWMDTTEISNPGEGNHTTVALIISYTADAMETVAGVPALKVTATSTSKVTGTMDNPMAGPMEVEGAGTGGGTFYIGTDGRFLGGTLASTINQQLKVAGAPAPIPVKTVQRLTVTAIP